MLHDVDVGGLVLFKKFAKENILKNQTRSEEERKKRPLPDGVSTKGKMTLVHIEIGENNGRNG